MLCKTRLFGRLTARMVDNFPTTSDPDVVHADLGRAALVRESLMENPACFNDLRAAWLRAHAIMRTCKIADNVISNALVPMVARSQLRRSLQDFQDMKVEYDQSLQAVLDGQAAKRRRHVAAGDDPDGHLQLNSESDCLTADDMIAMDRVQKLAADLCFTAGMVRSSLEEMLAVDAVNMGQIQRFGNTSNFVQCCTAFRVIFGAMCSTDVAKEQPSIIEAMGVVSKCDPKNYELVSHMCTLVGLCLSEPEDQVYRNACTEFPQLFTSTRHVAELCVALHTLLSDKPFRQTQYAALETLLAKCIPEVISLLCLDDDFKRTVPKKRHSGPVDRRVEAWLKFGESVGTLCWSKFRTHTFIKCVPYACTLIRTSRDDLETDMLRRLFSLQTSTTVLKSEDESQAGSS